jgi:uncharacterized membrane protein
MNSSEFERISEINQRELAELHSFLQERVGRGADLKLLNELHLALTGYCSRFEKYLAKCSSSGLTRGQLADVRASLENVLQCGLVFWSCLRDCANLAGTAIEPATNFLSTAQAALKGIDKASAENLTALYVAANLPVRGFMSKPIDLKEKRILWPVAIGGMALLILAIVLAFALGIKDGAQYLMLRIVACLSVGLILAGFLSDPTKINYKRRGLAFTAAGGSALFVFSYLVNPPPAPDYRPNLPTPLQVPAAEESGAGVPKAPG